MAKADINSGDKENVIGIFVCVAGANSEPVNHNSALKGAC